MIIDTHVHLDVKQFKNDIAQTIQRAKDRGVDRFIIPAIESDNMDGILELAEKYDEIYFSTGNHPNRLDTFDIKRIESFISHEKCVAVGECGLDWYRIPKGAKIEDVRAEQKDIFEQQILLSSKYNKPLILHSRDTDIDMVDTLMKHKDILVGGVVHCYVGSEKLLELEKYGFYFGIGGVLTYPSATDLRENVKKIPFDKILIETDAPYLTPVPNRGKRNEPSYTPFVVKELASILNKPINIVEEQAYKNTLNLFF